MKIALGCDHGGSGLMDEIRALLDAEGCDYTDYGCHGEAVDYPDYAGLVCRAVESGQADVGILICGTGIGMSIAANKFEGIRCALVSDCYSAKMTREHNDANVLAMGGRVLGPELAKMITKIFLTTPFSGEERHLRRIKAGMGAYKQTVID